MLLFKELHCAAFAQVISSFEMSLSPESMAAHVLIDTLLAMDQGESVQMAQTLLNDVDHHLLP